MKKLFLVLMVVGFCGAAVFAQEEGASQMEKKGIVRSIMNDLAENTRTVHEINKENIAFVRAESRANFEAATAPNPRFTEFRRTKGFWNKVKFLVSYRPVLEEQKADGEAELPCDSASM